MERYEEPIMEVLEMDREDVILTSRTDGQTGDYCPIYTPPQNNTL